MDVWRKSKCCVGLCPWVFFESRSIGCTWRLRCMVMVPQVGTHSSSVDVGYMARSTLSLHRSIGCLINSSFFLGMDWNWSQPMDCLPGWWFGKWLSFFPSYWECHHPNWRTHIFQRGRLNHQPAALSDCLFHSTILGTIRQNQHGMEVRASSWVCLKI